MLFKIYQLESNTFSPSFPLSLQISFVIFYITNNFNLSSPLYHQMNPPLPNIIHTKLMDLSAFQPPPLFPSSLDGALEAKNGFYKMSKENPFADSFPDPLCNLNLKETSDFVKSLPENRAFLDLPSSSSSSSSSAAAQRRSSVTKRTSNVETPCTPGRPIFSFSSTTVGNTTTRKHFPSKWDDAEKWLMNGHDSPQNNLPSYNLNPKSQIFAEKSRVTEESISKIFTGDHHNGASVSNSAADVLLKDKFTNQTEPNYPKFSCSETTKEGFLFSAEKEVIKHRDMGTEMTPLGSSTTSRCHTPFKISSPARHNTPADRSGPLALTNSSSSNNSAIDIAQLQECHLAKLQQETKFEKFDSNWSSREEEEEEISKSLRHFEISYECRKSVSEPRACAWEEEEKTKCCLRYQREEAKIQAWVNLQNAKAEAQMKKLEVKIQKMRSNLEEKLMKRMGNVHRKAEELRAAAQVQHSDQMQKTCEHTKKIMDRYNSHFSGRGSCSCFPCNNHHNVYK